MERVEKATRKELERIQEAAASNAAQSEDEIEVIGEVPPKGLTTSTSNNNQNAAADMSNQSKRLIITGIKKGSTTSPIINGHIIISNGATPSNDTGTVNRKVTLILSNPMALNLMPPATTTAAAAAAIPTGTAAAAATASVDSNMQSVEDKLIPLKGYATFGEGASTTAKKDDSTTMTEVSSKTSVHYGDCACTGGDPANLDGCSYFCPRCSSDGANVTFPTLSGVTKHILRQHRPRARRLLRLLKGVRREAKTECRLCGDKVVMDRVELGFHVWDKHGLPLQAYVNMK